MKLNIFSGFRKNRLLRQQPGKRLSASQRRQGGRKNHPVSRQYHHQQEQQQQRPRPRPRPPHHRPQHPHHNHHRRDLYHQHHLSAVLVLLPLLVPLCHAEFNPSVLRDTLTAVQQCNADTNPALAVAVVKDGSVLLSEGFGFTTPGGNENVRADTRFNIASLTKAFTATLLLKVMQTDGRYNLSTKLREILGEDFVLGDDVRTMEATVEDILAHKMAVPANDGLRFSNNLTRANLKDRLQYLESPDVFRNDYIYSNLFYGLATRITEILAGERWEDLVRKHLYDPLGLNRSTFTPEAVGDLSGFARAYTMYFGNLKPVSTQLSIIWSELSGSGSVVTTADDMAKWMNFHLTKGLASDGRRQMDEATMEELYKPRTAMDKSALVNFQQPKIPVTLSYDVYGFGFRRGYYRGYPLVGHGGSSYGYRSLLTLIPSFNAGVFVVMTGGDLDYRLRGTLTSYLLDHVLDTLPAWLNETTLCSFPEPWMERTEHRKPPYEVGVPLAFSRLAYPGLYHHPAYGTFQVREWQSSGHPDDGREPTAPFTLFYGHGTWDLIPQPPDTSPERKLPDKQAFYGKGRNVTVWMDFQSVEFYAPPEGSDVIIKLNAVGFELRGPPMFYRMGYLSGSSASSSLGCLLFVSVFSLILLVEV